MESMIQALIADPDRTNAIAAAANVALVFAALIIAVVSIFLSIKALKHQKLHNRLSVKPIPFVSLADYVNCIRIKIVNNGSGPLIIKAIAVSDGAQISTDLISRMPALPKGIFWSNFSSGLANRSVLPGHELILIELKGDTGNKVFSAFRKKCRGVLKNLEVTVEFTDIYESTFPSVSRKLDWFARP